MTPTSGFRSIWLSEVEPVCELLLETGDPRAVAMCVRVRQENAVALDRWKDRAAFRFWPAGPREASLLTDALNAVRLPQRGLLSA